MCLRYPNTQWACTATKCMPSRTEYEVPESTPVVPGLKPVKTSTKNLRPSTIRRQQKPPQPFIEHCRSPDCTGATTDVDTVHIMAVDCVSCHKRRGRDMRWHLESEWWFRSHGYGEKLGPKFEDQCWKYKCWAACAWDQMWGNMTDDAFTKKGTPMYGAVLGEQMRIVDGYWRVLMTWTRKNFPEQKAALGEQGKKRKRGSGDDEDDSDDSDDDEDDDDDTEAPSEDGCYKSDTELNDPRPKQRRRLFSSLAGSNTDGCGGGERGQRRKMADPRKMSRRGFDDDYGADPDDDYDADADDTDDDYDTEVPSEDDVYRSDTDPLLDPRLKGWGVGQKRKRAAPRKMGRPGLDDDGGEVTIEDGGYDTELPDLRPTQRQRRSSSSLTGSDTDGCGVGQKRKRAAPRKMGRPGPDNEDGDVGESYDAEVLSEDSGYEHRVARSAT